MIVKIENKITLFTLLAKKPNNPLKIWYSLPFFSKYLQYFTVLKFSL